MARTVTIDVRGLPRPQGSMRTHAMPNGKVAVRYPPAVYAWRAQVQQAAAETMLAKAPFSEAVELRLGFDLPRPANHYGTGRNSAIIKPSAPAWPTTMPDVDKLVRCVSDALTDSGLWKDDAQVVVITAAKRYATPPGVRIVVTELS